MKNKNDKKKKLYDCLVIAFLILVLAGFIFFFFYPVYDEVCKESTLRAKCFKNAEYNRYGGGGWCRICNGYECYWIHLHLDIDEYNSCWRER